MTLTTKQFLGFEECCFLFSISESPPARTSSPSSSRYSSNYGSAVLGSSTPTPSWRSTVYSSPSLLRKTGSDIYTSSYQPSNRSRSTISTSRARDDDDDGESKADLPRKSAYSRAAASLDALSSLELTSKYANSSTPAKPRPSYSRQESLEKARGKRVSALSHARSHGKTSRKIELNYYLKKIELKT